MDPCEFAWSNGILYRQRTSGLNRKLSIFWEFKWKSGNLRVKTGVIRDAQSDNAVSFEIEQKISGFNRKLSIFSVLK